MEDLLLRQQKKIRELNALIDEAHRETSEWKEKAEGIHQEYMELTDLMRRGDFVKVNKDRVVKQMKR